MTEREKQTDFLVRLLVLSEPHAEHELHARIDQAQHDERCVGLALALVTLIGGFAIAGLGYCAVLHPEFFDSATPTLVKLFCAVGLGSLMCMIVFLGYWVWYRSISNRLYEECRQLVMHAIQSRLTAEPKPVFVQTLDFSLPVSSHEPTSAAG